MSHAVSRGAVTRAATFSILTAFALGASGCLVVNRDHLDELSGGSDGGGVDAQTAQDGGADAGPDESVRVIDSCGNTSATYTVFADSTGGQLRVDTSGMSNRVSSCGSRSAPGDEGFIAIDVQAGDQWHFHVIPDPSVAGQDRDPFLYLLDSTCRNTACEYASDSCRGAGDEHFAFVAPSDGRFYLGIDDRNAGSGIYLIEAVKLVCGDGLPVHGEACDGSSTCNRNCREILSDTRPNEQIPNDNEIEGNFIEMPVSNQITISGTIGGDLCTYPDVFNFTVANDATNLTVDVLKSDMTVCDSGTLTPFDIVLRNTAGEVRAGPQTNATTGCAELRVTGLNAANYFLYVEHAEPLDRPVPYSLRITESL